jgi:hypothetical protein
MKQTIFFLRKTSKVKNKAFFGFSIRSCFYFSFRFCCSLSIMQDDFNSICSRIGKFILNTFKFFVFLSSKVLKFKPRNKTRAICFVASSTFMIYYYKSSILGKKSKNDNQLKVVFKDLCSLFWLNEDFCTHCPLDTLFCGCNIPCITKNLHSLNFNLKSSAIRNYNLKQDYMFPRF